MENILNERLQPDQIVSDEGLLDSFSLDETGVYHARPGLVVYPLNIEDISFVLSNCNRLKIPLTPRGAGTGLSGNSVSVPGGVLMIMDKMNQVISFDEESGIIRIMPGMIVDLLKSYVRERGWYYPVDPASSGTSLIGGHVNTNAAGPHSFKYGSTKQYVNALTLVMADGTIIHTGNHVEKSSTGYNLTQLICGSEGTLAVVGEISLKLVRPPITEGTVLISFASYEDGLNAILALRKSGVNISAIEWMERAAIEIVAGYEDNLSIELEPDCACHLLIDLEAKGNEDLEEEMIRIGELLDPMPSLNILVSDSEQSRQKLWRIRKLIGVAVRHHSIYREVDTVVPVSMLVRLIEIVKEVGNKYNFRSICYGHAANGNIHVNILRENKDDTEWNKILREGIEEIFKKVIELGGVLSGEHGIGLLNRPFMHLQFSEPELTIMKGIKAVFDPNHILNPDKVIP